jgi:hypothetical protein
MGPLWKKLIDGDDPAIKITFLGELGGTLSPGNVYSGTFDIGSAHGNKEIFLVATGFGSSRTLTAASTTVAGIAVTKATSESTSSSIFISCAYVDVSGIGGSQTITVTMSNTVSGMRVGVYEVLNRVGSGNEDDYTTTNSAGATSFSHTTTTISNNGFALAGFCKSGTAAVTETNIDEDAEIFTTATYWVGSRQVQVSGSTPTLSWSWTGSVGYRAASWSFS